MCGVLFVRLCELFVMVVMVISCFICVGIINFGMC